MAYLEQVDSDSHGLYRRVTRAALWMESTCSFLKEIQAKVEEIGSLPTTALQSAEKFVCTFIKVFLFFCNERRKYYIPLFLYFLAKGEKKWFDLLELAGQAIEGLPFHQHLPVIQECIHMCSYLYDKDIIVIVISQEFHPTQTKSCNS